MPLISDIDQYVAMLQYHDCIPQRNFDVPSVRSQAREVCDMLHY